jgi:hypothetical protein
MHGESNGKGKGVQDSDLVAFLEGIIREVESQSRGQGRCSSSCPEEKCECPTQYSISCADIITKVRENAKLQKDWTNKDVLCRKVASLMRDNFAATKISKARNGTGRSKKWVWGLVGVTKVDAMKQIAGAIITDIEKDRQQAGFSNASVWFEELVDKIWNRSGREKGLWESSRALRVFGVSDVIGQIRPGMKRRKTGRHKHLSLEWDIPSSTDGAKSPSLLQEQGEQGFQEVIE